MNTKNTASLPKAPTFEQAKYMFDSMMRNERLNRMGGFDRDFGFDEPKDLDEARADNLLTDQLAVRKLGGETV